MKRLVLCDFDGTISTEDLGYILLTHFSSGDWETIDRQFCEGKIGRPYKEGAFSGKAEKHLETPRSTHPLGWKFRKLPQMNQLLRSGPIQQKNTKLLALKYTISPIAPETEEIHKNDDSI